MDNATPPLDNWGLVNHHLENKRWQNQFAIQGPVVQKPVNDNLGLKFNQGFCSSSLRAFQLLIFSYRLKAAKV